MNTMLAGSVATPPSPYTSNSAAASPAPYLNSTIQHPSPSDGTTALTNAAQVLSSATGFQFDPASTDFADLLAEFTLPGNMLSPDSQSMRSPEPTADLGTHTGDFAAALQASTYLRNATDDQKNRTSSMEQAFGMQQNHPDNMSGYGSDGNSAPAPPSGGAGSKQQLAQAIANMDPGTQGQLLAALLAAQGSSAANSLPSNVPETVPPVGHPAYPHSQPASAHGSPHPFQSYNNSPRQMQRQQQAAAAHQYQVQHMLASQYQLASALQASLPASPVSSPYYQPGSAAQSPYFPIDPNLYPPHSTTHSDSVMTPAPAGPTPGAPSTSTSQPASNPPFPTPPMAFHNAFSPRPFGPPSTNQGAVDAQTHQAQLAMEVLARVSGNLPRNVNPGYNQGESPAPTPSGIAGDLRIRGGSATGASYATTAGDNEWGDNDFIFSPLMSPALTPQSVFSANSSLPPSASLQSQAGANGVTPADFFSPLSSPAIMPQGYTTEYPQVNPGQWNQAALSQSNSLQGLVDQTRALAFDANGLPGSPNTFNSPRLDPTNGSSMSPRVGPQDAGQSTATGSGRRGAGSKKTRPSPLLKPTPDTAAATSFSSTKSLELTRCFG
ncbi:hypothetical protein T439DRAFT_127192 [Meredithblackwellia eburnea MCA 4105]